ncbi:unnamed protein product [Lota lota]
MIVPGLRQVHHHRENNPLGLSSSITTWNALPACYCSSIHPHLYAPIAASLQCGGVQAVRQFSSAQLGSMGAICQLWRNPGGVAREV